MKSAMRLAIVFIAVFFLFSGTAMAESYRENICKTSANIYLRVQASVDPTSFAVGYSCLCNVPTNAYNNYMNYCMNQFSDQAINQIANQMYSSQCSNYASLPSCIR